MNDFDFQPEQPSLIEIFKSDNEMGNISNVWHEMGHIIGNLICKRIGFSEGFGDVKEIHLKGLNNSKVLYEDLFLSIENAQITYDKRILDFYGYPNGEYSDSSNEKILKKIIEDDPKRFFTYLIQLFSGGLFNIFYLNPNPNQTDFERCFQDYDVTSLDYIDGRAGSDWTKCRKYSAYIKANLGEIIYFRNGLFEFFKDHKLFEVFQELIKDVAKKFNNEIIKDQDVQYILVKIEEILNEIDEEFFKEIIEKINLLYHKVFVG